MEHGAARVEVNGEHLQPAVGGAVRRRVVSFGSRSGACRRGPARRGRPGAQLSVVADTGQHHLAVVDLAEDVLEVAGPAARDVGRPAEAEARGLEDIAEALGGDPQVVLGLGPARLAPLGANARISSRRTITIRAASRPATRGSSFLTAVPSADAARPAPTSRAAPEEPRASAGDQGLELSLAATLGAHWAIRVMPGDRRSPSRAEGPQRLIVTSRSRRSPRASASP